jgi:acetaldehyde dehydrogenase/alcohol dehydrogenase
MSTTKTREIVTDVEKLEKALIRVREAQRLYATYTQEQVDAIFKAAHGRRHGAHPAGQDAVTETGMAW